MVTALLLLLNPMFLQAMPDEVALAGGSLGEAPMTLHDHHPASGWVVDRATNRSADDSTSCTRSRISDLIDLSRFAQSAAPVKIRAIVARAFS